MWDKGQQGGNVGVGEKSGGMRGDRGRRGVLLISQFVGALNTDQ